jgi:orotidine-5'-phosphate decarboxylase
LTSTPPESLGEQGISLPAQDLVLRRAAFAADAGFDGAVSSPLEAPALKQAFGNKLAIVCPGIRPQAAPAGDQVRSATPAEAIRAGVDYLVVGRPVTRAGDPAAAARAIIAEIAGALGRGQPR